MKMIHYSLVATYVAVFAAVDAPRKLLASDALDLKSAISAIGFGDPLLAEAAAQVQRDPTSKRQKLTSINMA